jgi:hypothetical protein
MANQSWVSLLNPASPQASGAGAPISSSATTATISPVAGGTNASDVAQVQPAGQPYGWYPGLLIRVTAQGYITTTATASNYTFFLASRVGNSGSTWVTLATTATITGTTTVYTGLPWTLTAIIRCTGIATSGNTVSTQGQLSMTHNTTAPSLGATTGSVDLSAYLPASSGETAAAVDTTQLQGLSLRCTTSAAQGTVQLTQWLAEALD